MRMITLNLPEGYLQEIDELVKKHLYPNRTEAIRLFIRDGLPKKVSKKAIAFRR